MTYFKDKDFICRCEECKQERVEQIEVMNITILETIDKLREAIGEPIYINSGYRCITHPITKKKINEKVQINEKVYNLLNEAGYETFLKEDKFYTYALYIDNHFNGYAIDFRFKSMNNDKIIEAIRSHKIIDNFNIIKRIKDLEIHRIGVANNFIHIDNNPFKNPAFWIY